MRLHLAEPDPPLNVASARAAMLAERAQITHEIGLHFALVICPLCSLEFDGIGITGELARAHAVKAVDDHALLTHQN